MGNKKTLAESAMAIMKAKSMGQKTELIEDSDDTVVEAKKDFSVHVDGKEVAKAQAHHPRTAKRKVASAAAEKLGVKTKDVKKAYPMTAFKEDVDQAAQNAASVQPRGKVDALGIAITTLASMSGDEINKLLQVLQQNSQTAAAGIPDDTAAKNAASVAMKGAIQEDLDLLFGDQELSEEFKENISVLFEAAVTSRVSLVEADLQEQFDEALQEAIGNVADDLVNQLDQYLNYVAEQWMEENEVAIENSLKIEIAENILGGIKDVLVENYFEIPEDKIDVVEALTHELEEAHTALNEEIERNIELNGVLVEFQKEMVFNQISEGLTSMDANKLQRLSESVDYDGDESYSRKLSLIREQYFGKGTQPKKTSGLITEEIAYENEDSETRFTAPSIRSYAEAISRSVKTNRV